MTDDRPIQYLFDIHRTGRLHTSLLLTNGIEEVWSFSVRSNPPKGPESTPVFDTQMNMYFGCHDGCFYSLDQYGKLRWMYKTDKKIYSSPTLYMDTYVVVAGGDGYLYCFTTDGNVHWIYDISNGFRKKTFGVILDRISTLRKTIDYSRKRPWDIYSWSSPLVNENGEVFVSGYGKGIHSIDIQSGNVNWTKDLGSPRFCLAGVCLNQQGEIYCAAQQEQVYCLDQNGATIWTARVKSGYDIWSNPSFDEEYSQVYIVASFRERDSVVYSLDSTTGKIKWSLRLPNAIRGSVAISYENYVLVVDFGGYITFISKTDGSIIKQVRVSDSIRALWTTPSIDRDGNILLTTKDSFSTGSLICLNKSGEILWRNNQVGKTLSTPVIVGDKIYIGSWKGSMICFRQK